MKMGRHEEFSKDGIGKGVQTSSARRVKGACVRRERQAQNFGGRKENTRSWGVCV